MCIYADVQMEIYLHIYNLHIKKASQVPEMLFLL